MNTITHLKYGPIFNPQYESMEQCFNSWDEQDEDEPPTFGVATELRKLPKQQLINFLNEFMSPKVNCKKTAKDYVWDNCFGKYYNYFDYECLSKDELVYFILNSENHGILKQPSIWEILPQPHQL